MKRILKKLFLFAGINLVLLVALLVYFSGRNSEPKRTYWKTESNLLVMGDGEHYDLTFLGTSRGRTMSRDSNHVIVENMLHKRVMNLSKGGGSGVIPAELFLNYFYSRGNTTDHLVYFIDPWVLYSRTSNEDNGHFIATEPFETGLLTEMVKMRLPVKKEMYYFKSIWNRKWEGPARPKRRKMFDTLPVVDEELLVKARKHYEDRIDMDNFANYCENVQEIIRVARAHGTTVSFVILPILLHDFPGKDPVVQFLKKEAAAQPEVYFYDFSEEMADRVYFYDHIHFNRNGVTYFTGHYLQPIVLAKQAQSRLP